MDNTTIPAAIQHAISAAKLSQRELAKNTGISQPTVSRIIAGQRTPKLPELILIAEATGVPLAQLTGANQTQHVHFVARSSNGATMNSMQQQMQYFVELNAYLDDQAI